jgi:hexosaminidase
MRHTYKTMKNLLLLTFAYLLIGFASISCKENNENILSFHAIIPEPNEIISGKGYFNLNPETGIIIAGENDLENELAILQNILKNSLGFELPSKESGSSNVIMIDLNKSLNLKPEEYHLVIDENKIHIESSSTSGIFYAIQTIDQLIPTKTGLGLVNEYKIPAGIIKDSPEYAYRGMMLDVARHFFEVDDVKTLIDQLSNYKINHLHLHLSDDQGWRIEIKSWPYLTQIGGSTEVGGGKGGFYTQEDYKEIVNYAMKRHMTIVPEIDMPGHTNSALASYGVLNPGIVVPEANSYIADRQKLGIKEVDSKVSALYTGIEVGFSTIDFKNENTYRFVEDVIREISEITPGPYIHIGGDETLVVAMEDYIPFMEKAQEFVQKYGKIALGWDEIAHSKMTPGNIAQFWSREENARMALNQGNQILFSPATKIYLDMQYDSTTQIGLHWAAYVEVDDAYLWDPMELVNGIKKEQILGVEGPLWTETITNRSEIEFMIFPRVTALAEIAWSKKENRSWENYKRKITNHYKRWDDLGINYYKSPKI